MKTRAKPQTLIACREFYVEDCLARGQSLSTGATKDYLLGLFIQWCLLHGIRRVNQLDLDVLEAYRRYLFRYRKERGQEPLARSTQRMRLMAVTGILKRLHDLQKACADFYKAFELPRVKKCRLIDLPSEEDIECIIAQTLTRGSVGIRDRAILELCYGAGIRRAELANLDFRDIDERNKLVKIRKGKGGTDRQVPIAPRTIKAVQDYIQLVRPELASLESGEALFLGMTGKRIQKSALTDLIGTYIARSGIGVKGACHILRHAAASHMLRNGADIRYIQDYLGHEHLVSTQIYTHVYQEDLARVYANTHPAARSMGGFL